MPNYRMRWKTTEDHEAIVPADAIADGVILRDQHGQEEWLEGIAADVEGPDTYQGVEERQIVSVDRTEEPVTETTSNRVSADLYGLYLAARGLERPDSEESEWSGADTVMMLCAYFTDRGLAVSGPVTPNRQT